MSSFIFSGYNPLVTKKEVFPLFFVYPILFDSFKKICYTMRTLTLSLIVWVIF